MPIYEVLLSVHQSIKIHVRADNMETANLIAQYHYDKGEAYDGDSEVISTTETETSADIDQSDIDLTELESN